MSAGVNVKNEYTNKNLLLNKMLIIDSVHINLIKAVEKINVYVHNFLLLIIYVS